PGLAIRRQSVADPGHLERGLDLPHQLRAGLVAREEGMTRILIVDYGMANLRSVQKGFEKVGHAAEITADPNRLTPADKLVLPGVGAFRDAIARLREAGLAAPIGAHARSGKPFLRVCLGPPLLR